ncbi:3-keto-5-aminohexanoate cleavage protein [Haloplanus sp. GCM10025708]
MSEHLPITPDELVEEGIAAAEAGASIIHIHVRDPETGEPVSDLDLFREVASGIQAETDAIVQPTTGGGFNQTVEERFSVIPELQPEMASFNMGSMNFGLYPMAEKMDEFEYEWEREYLENTYENIVPNSFSTLHEAGSMFTEHGVHPELECYDVGHLHTAKHLYDRGVLEPPLRIQFVMGVLGGIAAESSHLDHMIETTERLFGDDASWSVIGAGKAQFPLGVEAVSRGGHVRVGLEDNLYLSPERMAESNAEQVEKIVDLAWSVAGREPATPAQVRGLFDTKGVENVGF